MKEPYDNAIEILVHHTKNAKFLAFYHSSELLSKCPCERVLPSGDYFFYKLNNVFEKERALIKRHQYEWAYAH